MINQARKFQSGPRSKCTRSNINGFRPRKIYHHFSFSMKFLALIFWVLYYQRKINCYKERKAIIGDETQSRIQWNESVFIPSTDDRIDNANISKNKGTNYYAGSVPDCSLNFAMKYQKFFIFICIFIKLHT